MVDNPLGENGNTGALSVGDRIIRLQDVLNVAIRETKQMMESGVDISNPWVVTPLAWVAKKYPEIAENCNWYLRELVEEQRKKRKED